MASEWLPGRTRHNYTCAYRRKLSAGALAVTGSSERQLLTDASARLVLTHQPYHDDLKYGEFPRLLHTWMQEVLGVPHPDEFSEAVPFPDLASPFPTRPLS